MIQFDEHMFEMAWTPPTRNGIFTHQTICLKLILHVKYLPSWELTYSHAKITFEDDFSCPFGWDIYPFPGGFRRPHFWCIGATQEEWENLVRQVRANPELCQAALLDGWRWRGGEVVVAGEHPWSLTWKKSSGNYACLESIIFHVKLWGRIVFHPSMPWCFNFATRNMNSGKTNIAGWNIPMF